MHSVRRRMQALLDSLDYDFSQFTMENFRLWVEHQRGKKIELVPFRIPSPTVSGAWLAGETRDFIFYEYDTPPVHQVLIQLHELSHMLCKHPTLQVSDNEIYLAFRGAAPLDEIKEIGSLLLRSDHGNEAELEAETLASLIQETVLRYHRMEELTRAAFPSSGFTGYFSDYIEALGKDD
jgi:hypothetical protein